MSKRRDELLSASVSWAQVGVDLLPSPRNGVFGFSLSNTKYILLIYLICLSPFLEYKLHGSMDSACSFLTTESSTGSVYNNYFINVC